MLSQGIWPDKGLHMSLLALKIFQGKKKPWMIALALLIIFVARLNTEIKYTCHLIFQGSVPFFLILLVPQSVQNGKRWKEKSLVKCLHLSYTVPIVPLSLAYYGIFKIKQKHIVFNVSISRPCYRWLICMVTKTFPIITELVGYFLFV